MVTQNGETVLDDTSAHHHDGMGVHETAPLDSSDPVDITITFQGYGVDDPKTGPIGEEVVFSNVVPEFGTIAMMILAVAIISIVAVTAKSRVIPRF
jgi:predicted secreted protein with PEFG-CTERM motif